MLAYAVSAHPARRSNSPSSLALILAGHAVLIGAVMSAKMELVPIDPFNRTEVINVPIPPPPPPPPTDEVEPTTKQPVTQDRFIRQERPIVDMGQSTSIALDNGQALRDLEAVIGSGPTTVIDPPKADPVRIGPRLATNENAIKPPYPLDKRRAEEEATLRLRLSIDARGRVIAVEPVGVADPSFLEAARRHIIRAWRYKPATEDGIAIPSSTVINLSFRLEDV
jgi:periplasmic protein TonB